MAPTDRIHLPFRWQFVPSKDPRDAGFDLHLVKPVDQNDLSRALNDRNGATLH